MDGRKDLKFGIFSVLILRHRDDIHIKFVIHVNVGSGAGAPSARPTIRNHSISYSRAFNMLLPWAQYGASLGFKIQLTYR